MRMAIAHRLALLVVAVLATFVHPTWGQQLQWTISPTLPVAVEGVPYNVQLSVTGGVAPYLFTLEAGSLPDGWPVESDGKITGTPTTSQFASFTVRVTDAQQASITRTFSLTVNPPLSITTSSLPPVTAGSAYSASLAAAGGRPGYTWASTPSLTSFGLNLSASSGNITGTPTEVGEIVFTAEVTDSYNPANMATRQFSITVLSPLQITTNSLLPQATQNAAYTVTFAVSGAVGNTVWDVTSGQLPPGLDLSASNGTLSGTPIQSGNYSFTLRVRDQNENSATRAFSLTVLAELTITSGPQLPAGTAGSSYTTTLLASGGAAPYNWSLVSAGTLPPGLNLSSGGTISGTPTEAGDFSPVVRVTDSGGISVERTLMIAIAPELVITTDSELPAAGVQQQYAAQLAATGGNPPYSWSVAQGSSLPPGLSLAPSTGMLSGTPTVQGSFSFAVRVTDTRGVSTQRTFTLLVDTGLVITTGPMLPTAFTGAEYSVAMNAVGGEAPYSWSLAEGSELPAGLNLDAATGLLSGAASSAGNFSFTIRVEDSAEASAERAIQLTVLEPLQLLTMDLPGATPGEPYAGVTLQATGGTSPYSYRLAPESVLPSGLTLSSEGTIAGTPTEEGDFGFTVTAADEGGLEVSTAYRILVRAGLQFATPGMLPPATTGEPMEIQLLTTGGAAPVSFTLVDSTLPEGLSLSPEGSLTGTPQAPATASFAVRATDSGEEQQSVERGFTLRIADPVVLTTETLPVAEVDENYGQGIEAQGGVGGFTFSVVEGQLPEGMSLSANGFLSGVPVVLGGSSFTVRVSDQDGREASRAYTLQVVPLVVSDVSISPESGTPDPNEQQTVGVQIAEAVSADLEGELILSFVPAINPPVDDPAVQFVSGGRTVVFTVPEGTTEGRFGDQPDSPPFQTGTVAGDIVLSVRLLSGGVDVTPVPTPTVTVQVPTTAPTLTDLEVTRNGNQLTAVVRGFSTPRAMASATLTFVARAGANISGGLSFTVDLAPVFTAWYASENSTEHGSRFRLTLPVTISGDAADITGLSIRLRNQSGESNSLSAEF